MAPYKSNFPLICYILNQKRIRYGEDRLGEMALMIIPTSLMKTIKFSVWFICTGEVVYGWNICFTNRNT